ncbi:MAG: 5'-methylthioadenosine phosphorylase, partial [Candidatus Thermoplasmatota archaeon]
PRLETKAEINLLKNYADVVGMNFASEATLANELKIKIANLSSVDNYAHGIIEQELSFEKILENARKNAENLIKVLRGVVKRLE